MEAPSIYPSFDDLQRLNEFDFKVYNWAKKRLEATVDAMPEADKAMFKAMSEQSTKVSGGCMDGVVFYSEYRASLLGFLR